MVGKFYYPDLNNLIAIRHIAFPNTTNKRRMNRTKINICKMQLDPTSCDYVIRNIGCRCCHRGCTRQNCNYRCKNDPEKCGILEECETENLSPKYKVNWEDYK